MEGSLDETSHKDISREKSETIIEHVWRWWMSIFLLHHIFSVLQPPTRNIHTSPALFSVERVMAGFRARSQLLVGRLEDGDDVLQQAFSDEDEDSMQAKQGGNKEADKKK